MTEHLDEICELKVKIATLEQNLISSEKALVLAKNSADSRIAFFVSLISLAIAILSVVLKK